jgi:glycosyltransferase involved in cell wall biosynthesis
MIDYFFHKVDPKNVKISMVMMVKNEEDIIADNIKFHANIGVDNFVILDNGSTDNTGDILKELSKDYEIIIDYNPSKAYKQKEWMTKLAKKAKKIFNPDWIINNDADEFWAPKNAESLKDVLNFKGGVLQVQRSNMLLYEGINNYKESEYRVINQILTREDYENLNIMLGKIGRKTIINPHGYIKTNAGNHSAEHIAFWKKKTPENIHIYHYPFRTFKQFETKVKLYVEILKENPNAKIGPHVKKWAKQYLNGKIEEEWNKIKVDEKDLECLQKFNIIKKDITMKNLFKKFELL